LKGLESIVRWSLLAGLCSLVPVPFLDAWLERRCRAHLYAGLARAHGVTFPTAQSDVLLAAHDGWMPGCVAGLVYAIVKKIFRTFFFFLTLVDVVHGASVTALRGVLVEAAFARGALPGDAVRVRDAMGEALVAETRHPVMRVVRGCPEAPVAELEALPRASLGAFARLVVFMLARAGAGTARDVFLARLEVSS
jgi:hypothetical protein